MDGEGMVETPKTKRKWNELAKGTNLVQTGTLPGETGRMENKEREERKM